jgi:predicted O-linked N-acetylglucosamine transferase (SPINDLY family)
MINPIAQAVEAQQKGELVLAEQIFRAILAENPNEPVSLYSLGIIILGKGEKEEALGLFKHGCESSPDFAYNWFGCGHTLQSLGRLEEAISAYDEAIRIKPDYLEALINSGVLLRDLHRHLDALHRFNRVLEVDPNYQNALGNCAILLTEFKESARAIAMMQRLLTLNPDYDYGPGLLIYERMHIGDWTDFDTEKDKIIRGVRTGKRTCKSLAFMALSDNAEEHYRCAKIFSEHYCPPARTPLWNGEQYNHSKLRIAYVSPDLREHPVGHLTCGIFENHDKSKFETIAISLGINDNSRLRQRMLNSFDRFIDVRGMPSQQIAALMRELEVDIAIDLAGYTADSRIDIFSYRPAPVHINFLGYPGTLAVDYMDYILADRHVIPPEHQSYYQEKVLYLPDTYLPTDSTLQPAEETPSRESCGLPPESIVFCSFSHDYKISPPLWQVWMSLMTKTPGSVLWLVARNTLTQENFRKAAADYGIAPERLVFAGRVPRVEDHLARYRLADIFLDTWPYNAHTTAADALISGLPVVTYMGKAFPARVAGGLLHAIGLPELVADSWDAYENLALKLVTDKSLLAQIKDKLIKNRFTQALFDTKRFCRNLEDQLLSVAKHKPAPQQIINPLVQQENSKLEWLSLLIDADQALENKNFPLAELIVRYFQRLSPENVQTEHMTHLLTQISNGYGFPFNSSFSENKNPASSDRHLLIRAWGYGFWSDVHHVCGQLLIAELSGRQPLVLWGNNSRFSAPDSTNAFDLYFQAIGNIDNVSNLPNNIYPPKWSSPSEALFAPAVNTWKGEYSRLSGQFLLNRNEKLAVSDFFTPVISLIPWIAESSTYFGLNEDQIYSRIFSQYIKPTPELLMLANDFYDRNMAGHAWLAVHTGQNDTAREDYTPFIKRIIELNPGIRILLLTDELNLAAKYQDEFKTPLLTLPVRIGSDIEINSDQYPIQNPAELARDAFVGTLLACKCNYFIGNKESNTSLAINSLKEWPLNFAFMFGQHSARSENASIYR